MAERRVYSRPRSNVAAAVVLEKDVSVTDEQLAHFLQRRLAGFKVPCRFLFVDSIPKGAAGKIQRRQLAEAFGLDGAAASVNPSEEDRPPTPLEAQLRQLWAESLGLDCVGFCSCGSKKRSDTGCRWRFYSRPALSPRWRSTSRAP